MLHHDFYRFEGIDLKVPTARQNSCYEFMFATIMGHLLNIIPHPPIKVV